MAKITYTEIFNPNGNFLFSLEELNSAKSRRKVLRCQCIRCGKVFFISKHDYQNIIQKYKRSNIFGGKYCSQQCANNALIPVKCSLETCNNTILRKEADIKAGYHFFCCSSHSAIFNNKIRKFSKSKRKEINSKISKSVKLFAENTHQENEAEYKLHPNYCEICGKPLPYDKRNQKTCSDECLSKLRSKNLYDLKTIHESLNGGYRKNCSRAKHGYYKGIWCDSSYELAFLIYCLDNNIPIRRCDEVFTYQDENGKFHKYFPDFIINDATIIEIKNYNSATVELKKNAVISSGTKYAYEIKFRDDLREQFNWVASHYPNIKVSRDYKSNNFDILYE